MISYKWLRRVIVPMFSLAHLIHILFKGRGKQKRLNQGQCCAKNQEVNIPQQEQDALEQVSPKPVNRPDLLVSFSRRYCVRGNAIAHHMHCKTSKLLLAVQALLGTIYFSDMLVRHMSVSREVNDHSKLSSADISIFFGIFRKPIPSAQENDPLRPCERKRILFQISKIVRTTLYRQQVLQSVDVDLAWTHISKHGCSSRRGLSDNIFQCHSLHLRPWAFS